MMRLESEAMEAQRAESLKHQRHALRAERIDHWIHVGIMAVCWLAVACFLALVWLGAGVVWRMIRS